MLNVEKYKNEILKVKDDDGCFAINRDTDEFSTCANFECRYCYFNEVYNSCSESQNKWMLSEYEEPIELTQDEYNFLHLLGEGYLARGDNNALYVFNPKPQKVESTYSDEKSKTWSGYIVVFVNNFEMLQDSFKFIKPEDEEPYSIKDILENYKIKEEEKSEI